MNVDAAHSAAIEAITVHSHWRRLKVTAPPVFEAGAGHARQSPGHQSGRSGTLERFPSARKTAASCRRRDLDGLERSARRWRTQLVTTAIARHAAPGTTDRTARARAPNRSDSRVATVGARDLRNPGGPVESSDGRIHGVDPAHWLPDDHAGARKACSCISRNRVKSLAVDVDCPRFPDHE